MRDKNYFPLLLTLPVVIFLLALLIYPLLYTFTIAFYDQESENLIPFGFPEIDASASSTWYEKTSSEIQMGNASEGCGSVTARRHLS